MELSRDDGMNESLDSSNETIKLTESKGASPLGMPGQPGEQTCPACPCSYGVT
jgi:hypothetical protein